MLPPRATVQIGRNERHRVYVHDHLEAVIETHRSGSRFWLQGADGEALRSDWDVARPGTGVVRSVGFFSPNCLPWGRRCARTVVGSRWYGNERQMRSRDPTTESGQPKLMDPERTMEWKNVRLCSPMFAGVPFPPFYGH